MAQFYEKGRRILGDDQSNYFAIADKKEKDGIPYANMSVRYTPPKTKPNFDNETAENGNVELDPYGVTGLSSHAFKKAEDLYQDDKDNRLTSETANKRANEFASIKKGLTAHTTAVNSTIPYDEYQFNDAMGLYKAKAQFAAKRASTHPYFQQDTLFDTTPSSLHINEMFSDPSMSTSAITLAAIAKAQYKPDLIVASHDLSPFSSKLVKNAENRGLIETHPENSDAEITNDEDYEPRRLSPRDAKQWTKGMRQIPETEVRSAKSDLRETLRGRKSQVVRNTTPVTPKGLSNQFLPGMEGFV